MGIFSILRESFVNMWEDLSIFLVNSDCQYLGENMNIFALKPIFELFKFLWGSLKYLDEFYQFFGPILNWGELLIFWASFILSNDKILMYVFLLSVCKCGNAHACSLERIIILKL